MKKVSQRTKNASAETKGKNWEDLYSEKKKMHCDKFMVSRVAGCWFCKRKIKIEVFLFSHLTSLLPLVTVVVIVRLFNSFFFSSFFRLISMFCGLFFFLWLTIYTTVMGFYHAVLNFECNMGWWLTGRDDEIIETFLHIKQLVIIKTEHLNQLWSCVSRELKGIE